MGGGRAPYCLRLSQLGLRLGLRLALPAALALAFPAALGLRRSGAPRAAIALALARRALALVRVLVLALARGRGARDALRPERNPALRRARFGPT
eukprot:8547567-Pyramimonas_sp.AAC.1